MQTDSSIEVLHGWYKTLRRAGLNLFDYWAERGDISEVDPRRIAMARQKLFSILNGKKIRQQLQIPAQKGRKI